MDEAENQRLCDIMRACLSEGFEFYKEDHTVQAGASGNHVWLVYCVGAMNNLETLRFDLNIEGDTCYIAWFKVPEAARRRGIGRKMYGALEEFCRKEGLAKVAIDAGGDTPKFYGAMGFEPTGDFIGMSKEL